MLSTLLQQENLQNVSFWSLGLNLLETASRQCRSICCQTGYQPDAAQVRTAEPANEGIGQKLEIKKLNRHYTRGNTRKRVKSAGPFPQHRNIAAEASLTTVSYLIGR